MGSNCHSYVTHYNYNTKNDKNYRLKIKFLKKLLKKAIG